MYSDVVWFDQHISGGIGSCNTRVGYGVSIEKRSDCPLITLALVLDGSGFVRRSKIYAGNVTEATTLSEELTEVDAPKEAIVVIGRGIASEQNVTWLHESGYRYLVVSREQARVFDPQDRTVTTLKKELELYEVRDTEQVRVYCRSRKRKQKEEAMVARYRTEFEAQLQQLNQGLSRPNTWKKLHLVHQRLGRIQKSSRGIWRHYEIEVVADPKGINAVEVKWKPRPRPNSMWTHPGTYCLRTNVMDLTTAQLWQTYIMLTDLEAVFRSPKSELGFRPIFHQTDQREIYEALEINPRPLETGITMTCPQATPSCCGATKRGKSPRSPRFCRKSRKNVKLGLTTNSPV
ncbi:MAG: hypothetical protein F4065_01610 [Rhodothermaceae bacterium]|nr:hypothetical protein [Bacteroidota bacterium]MXX96608.1 hypothetical protein [Rhodothermaceae bacterium]MDE2646404.1 hypothetical protein [Bacteroidota bacterium]MXZ18276.1 hypothetical protein [Rhodothermaceae bacterium]MXZ57305.1 hypothetical protein [Rhodothermaceae bacterium]